MAQPTPPPFKPSHPANKPASAHKSASGQPLPPSDTQSTDTAYQNNPFLVALDGISGLFKYAKVLGIIFVVLSAIGFLANGASSAYDIVNGNYLPSSYTDTSSSSPITPSNSAGKLSDEDFRYAMIMLGAFALVFAAVALLVGVVINGIKDVAAAAISEQRAISFGEILSTLFNRFGGYLWLQILIFVKIFLWSLLFIVPGIIMAIRYSLAGTAYFARNMKAGEALQHSIVITKGGWLTTFASYGLFNLVTLGAISLLTQTGTQGILHRQFDAYHQRGVQKPGAHALSVVFVVAYTLLILLALVVIGFFASLALSQP